ncbi:hypothetical protein LZ198_24080 [Myxococcus sp. K15C18031901]|uniref:hypothetical protein n=1 Tax=Myxococcus dinghuensis TaxID=2906761 RepID=UPI0020A70D94|nr:hypothetical protein [Myxococcus dinghuensis]MCP3101950.1 hypothetical protein [Myxococcus dinghuensis]
MSYRTLPALLILLCAACKSPGTGPSAPSPEGEARVELWVDAGRDTPGDGSRARPLRSLSEALGRRGPLTVHLAPGDYPGPHVVPPDTRLEGAGAGAVLLPGEGDGDGTVLRVSGGAALAGVEVRGGAWGLEVSGGGRVRLERMTFGGQRRGAVRLTGGRLEVEASRFEATVAETVGVLVEPEAASPVVAARSRIENSATRGGAVSGPASRVEAATREGVVSAPAFRAEAATREGAVSEPASRAEAATREGAVSEPASRAEAATREGAVSEPASRAEAATRDGAVSEPASLVEAGRPRLAMGGSVSGSTDAGPASGAVAREVWLREVRFVGPFRRAVRVRGTGSHAELADVTFTGPVTALGMDGGTARVRGATAERGTGAAFSVVEGGLTLEDVRVLGFEVAVSASRVDTLDVRDLLSLGATRAGLTVAASRGVSLEDVVVRGSGGHGAVQLVGSVADVHRLRVEDASEYGLMAMGGRVRVRNSTFVNVRSGDGVNGEALHLRQGAADVEGVVVRGAAGACVLVAQGAKAVLRDIELERCGQAGLLADTRATLEATGVDLREAVAGAVAVAEDATASVDGFSVKGALRGLVETECTGATRVRLTRVRAEDLRGTQARCVSLERPRPHR